MAKFEPVLLARIDKPNSTALAGYKADGGYKALEKSLAMKPDDVTNLVKDAGLRGRGGAGVEGEDGGAAHEKPRFERTRPIRSRRLL